MIENENERQVDQLIQTMLQKWQAKEKLSEAETARVANIQLGMKVLKLRITLLDIIAQFELDTGRRILHLYLDRTSMSLDDLYGDAPEGLKNRLCDVHIRLEKKEVGDE